MDRAAFVKDLKAAAKARDLKLLKSHQTMIVKAIGQPNEDAAVCRKKDAKNGTPEPDPKLRDEEYVPLTEDIQDYFEREVLPYVPDAWIDESKTDPQDGHVGIVGYEIPLNRHFYVYEPPRPLNEIEDDIRKLEQQIVEELGKVLRP